MRYIVAATTELDKREKYLTTSGNWVSEIGSAKKFEKMEEAQNELRNRLPKGRILSTRIVSVP